MFVPDQRSWGHSRHLQGTVHGRTGGIGQGFAAGSNRSINQGLIAADVPGGTLTLSPGRFKNTGTLRPDGATLLIRVLGFTNAGIALDK